MTGEKQKPIEMKDIFDVLVDIRNTMRESLKWAKFTGLKGVKDALGEQLPNDQKKLIYHLSDGTRGTQEIAKIVGGLSHQTVSNYWKEWEKQGLGESIAAPGGSRFKRIFDLEDLGMKVPTPKQNTSEPQTAEPPKTGGEPNG